MGKKEKARTEIKRKRRKKKNITGTKKLKLL
jgi:hypothetical protein